jgi:hypothetical protein
MALCQESLGSYRGQEVTRGQIIFLLRQVRVAHHQGPKRPGEGRPEHARVRFSQEGGERPPTGNHAAQITDARNLGKE